MTVTGIQKKGTANILVIFDSGEKLNLAYEVFLKRGLKKDLELTDDLFLSLKDENELFLVKQNAFRFLNRRLHSESELRLKLIRKGYGSRIVMEVIDNLKTSGYVNDYEFALSFRDEKINRYGWGTELIATALRKKGIPSEVVKEILQDISHSDISGKALTLLTKKYKLKSIKELDSIKNKMYSYLFSKGYDYESCRKAVDEYINLRKA